MKTDFQRCSINKGTVAWDTVQDLGDDKKAAMKKSDPGAAATIDEIKTEELLDMDRDVKPIYCALLPDIDSDCGQILSKCYTKADSDQMRRAHIAQMKGYFASLYQNLDLTDCDVKPVEEERPKPVHVPVDDANDEDEQEEEAKEDDGEENFDTDPDAAVNPDKEDTDPFQSEGTSKEFESGFDDFDPFLDYEGETNDINGPAGEDSPSQRSAEDDGEDGAAAASESPSTSSTVDTTASPSSTDPADGNSYESYRAAEAKGSSACRTAVSVAFVSVLTALLLPLR